MTDHDPFNEPETAHSRARELMQESIFWDCADDGAPFGNDEGFEAYYEWRDWRADNPNSPLTECFDWILCGNLSDYNDSLAIATQVERDFANPENAFLADSYDMFTLDTTILATGLGQLMDEGKIDPDAKPYMRVAVQRQRTPGAGTYDALTLDAIARVIDVA